MKLTPDYSLDDRLTAFGIQTLKDRYLVPGETSPQDIFMRAARAFSDDEAHARRMYSYFSRKWFGGSTPVLSNAPIRKSWGKTWKDNFHAKHFQKTRGLPISCFLAYVPDSRLGLSDHYDENIWLTSEGGGIGGYWGDVRSDGTDTSSGSKSTGSIPFMTVVDRQMLAFSQGKTRRGSYAAYQDISHPEVEEFIIMRKPSGGDENRKCLNLHHGLNIPDAFMEAVQYGRPWDLIDPHSKKVVKTVDARTLWQLILETRVAQGEPYLHFIDASNRAMPEAQKQKGLRIRQSNLCIEITLPTDEKRTAVCCLSSPNANLFDEWSQDPLFLEDCMRFLDNVLEYFIQNAGHGFERAVYSASQERAVGLGLMGFQSYLQRKNVPFESAMAVGLNRKIFKHIDDKTAEASLQLARERGEAPDMAGTGHRFAYRTAVAPNASSAIIVGVSPSCEAWPGNAFTQKTLSGLHLVKNPHLEAVLESYGRNDKATWAQIVTSEGSVQGLDFLTDWERDVYKTAAELNQVWVVQHAADRTPHISQSQSLNLYIRPGITVQELHAMHFGAWRQGVKSLYYLRNEAPFRAEKIGTKSERQVIETPVPSYDNCVACEG